MNPKKIGVITFWYTQDNYGQMLQMYSLQKYLKCIGHNPYIIRFDNRNQIIKKKPLYLRLFSCVKHPVKLIWYIRGKFKKQLLYITTERKFDEFRSKHFDFSSKLYNNLEDLQTDPPYADVYICGSDVIWSEGVDNMAYFLDFGRKDIKRIAYAPSFGTAKVSNSFMKKISIPLKKFDFVGVREESGVEICKKSNYYNAKWVPDPTLIVAPDVFNDITNDLDNINDFVFLYLLGSEKISKLDEIYRYADLNNFDVKQVASQGCVNKYHKIDATIEEWLSYIKDAKYVFTNSFHCCIMAILFHKKFLYLPLNGTKNTLNERIKSLLSNFDLMDRYNFSTISEIENDINWELIDSKIENDRNTVNKYFCEII